jgi:hypothetical protein
MSKFKNIGIAEAGVVPDLSGVFGRMVAGFQNISSQRQKSSNNLLQVFGQIKARSKKRAGIVETKANQVMASTDDIGLDAIINSKATDLNKPIQEASFVKQEDVDLTVQRLDNLDVMKDNIIRLKTKLVDFKKTASYENMSEEAIANFDLLLDNDFQIGDVTQRKIIIGGSEIDLNNLNKQYVARDAQGVRNTQIIINRHIDPKNVDFNSVAFNQDMNVLMDNRDHMGAKLMVADLSLGNNQTIRDQLEANLDSFTSLLNDSNVDLNKDGTPDGQQITQENAIEFIKILTTPGNENYDEATTNSFVKNFLQNQTSTIFEENQIAIKLNSGTFSLEEFFLDNGSTGVALKNIRGVTRNLSIGDIKTAKQFAMNLGFVIEKVDGDNYQLFKSKADLRETVKGGKTGRQDVPNPNFRKFIAQAPVGKKFDITDEKSLIPMFEVMLRDSGVKGFNPRALTTYMTYLEANPGDLFPGFKGNFDYTEVDNQE